jgi:hypothetical protein
MQRPYMAFEVDAAKARRPSTSLGVAMPLPANFGLRLHLLTGVHHD